MCCFNNACITCANTCVNSATELIPAIQHLNIYPNLIVNSDFWMVSRYFIKMPLARHYIMRWLCFSQSW